MKKIIVPIDFSEHSEYALEATAMLAKKFGADLCGIADVSDLKSAPSFILAPQMPDSGKGIGSRQGKLQRPQPVGKRARILTHGALQGR